ncbi:MAG TPA: hypothetical protein VER96_14135 [Polyangiaceae bacterium]|nr:hypothetical protein [Polyangiaceae bacterium]
MTEAEAPLLAEEESSDEPRKRPTRSDLRQTLLSQEPLLVGSSWAKLWCNSMLSDGRLVVGGWPGTMAEARARIQGHLSGELARRKMPALSIVELTAAASAAYQQAKKDWLLAARDTRPKGSRSSEDDEDEA